MSREAYQIPTSQGNAPGAGGAGGMARSTFDLEGATINYICGDCGFKFALRRSDTIRCKECGCRILYKERTKRMVQFEAR
ncbi:metallothionein-I transcription activator [Xylaria bambusicola]|uniref:metallothionein-I transcription activator n=1 Tax=Xylaria bambusicola TaxID=326684 RepID=UPI0020084DE4|nr:metallothionein-I transcription activator [Xylaria bambusicola]KAI0509310.1 metallothionein-I transcription activator [Xylaria bambusicola]